MKRMNKKIILICNSENPFLFNGCYYDQVDEVAMGSPLGTVVAKKNVNFSPFWWI